VDVLASVGGSIVDVVLLAAAEGGAQGEAEAPGFQINVFWVLTQAVSFLLFLGILYLAAFRRIGGVLEERRSRIEQGLRDADAARQERERAADERQQVISHAREEANDIVARAQRLADETRERELTALREEMERVRARAEADIAAERQRALGEVRGQIADLALRAAGRVVGETMNDERERRLVEEFLADVSPRGPGGDGAGPETPAPARPGGDGTSA
jgi:F-type H+-transporting ATPase subunit b